MDFECVDHVDFWRECSLQFRLQNKVLKRIYTLCESKRDRKTVKDWNEEIEALFRRKYIVRFINTQQLSWFGHVVGDVREMDTGEAAAWKRKGGKPRKRWI